MVTIKCDVYEKHQLLKYLDYCKKKKIEECNKGDITVGLLNFDLNILNNLINRVNGKYVEDYLMRSKECRSNNPREELDEFEKEVRKLAR